MENAFAPGLLLGCLIVIASVALAVGGLAVTRRYVHFSVLKADHDVAGFLYSNVGVVYAVLLGFITVVAWEEHRDTQGYVQQEAVRVSNLMRDAGVFPDAARKELRMRLLAYGAAVVGEEWQAMARRQDSRAASEAYQKIWDTIYAIQPRTEQEIAFYREAIARLNELGGIRRSRLLSSQALIPPLLWVLLVGGAVISVGFTFMFGAKNSWQHFLAAGSLSGLIGFVLFLILALNSPFSGSLSISPDALESVLRAWERGAYAVPG